MKLSDYLPSNRYQLIGFLGSIAIRVIADYYLGRTERIKWPAEIELISLAIVRLFSWAYNLKKGEKNGNP